MSEIGVVLEQLKQQRQKLMLELNQINAAIGALAKLGGDRIESSTRRISAAARKRISAAQKARWAKFRAKASNRAA